MNIDIIIYNYILKLLSFKNKTILLWNFIFSIEFIKTIPSLTVQFPNPRPVSP